MCLGGIFNEALILHLKGMTVITRRGVRKSWWGVVIFFPLKEGGTLETILYRNFQSFLRPPTLHYYLYVILVSSTISGFEKTDYPIVRDK